MKKILLLLAIGVMNLPIFANQDLLQLGQDYYYGLNGKDQNFVEAVKYFNQAAVSGNAEAKNYLGLCYYYGNGVTQSYTEAVKWFRKGAEGGNAMAQNNLGVCYYNGHGLTQSYTEAVKWFRKGAEGGSADAQNHRNINKSIKFKKGNHYEKIQTHKNYICAFSCCCFVCNAVVCVRNRYDELR